ncbi:MAG: hypothetical protein JWL77_7087, partial [Chthonomonadaceae bacterium]|nr:hypothetical protein [Chthonomonadaceae bacterium]
MTAGAMEQPRELPADNAVLIAIFDAMWQATQDGRASLTPGEIAERVLPRLRVLVPRELYNAASPEAYVEEKVGVCVEAGLLAGAGAGAFAATGFVPRVRYPNDEVRDYTPGLEAARERLDADNARLRDRHFDVRYYVPSLASDPDAPEFQALVASMKEHGFLKPFAVVRMPNGDLVDGRAREVAARLAGVEVETYSYNKRDRALARRRDTPLNRILLVLDANAGRLTAEQRAQALEAAAG